MKKYRNEWKYVCDEKSLRMLEERLRGILLPDPHAGEAGSYMVHSLYFDDLRNRCALEKEAGIERRAKYRIRYYNDNAELLLLERKEKHLGRCRKQSCRIDRDTYHALVTGEEQRVLWDDNAPLLRKAAASCMARGLRPCIVINYERTAFVEPIGNVRITMDRHISASGDVERFLEGTTGIPLQEAGFHVLEVKFDEILPGYIRRLVETPGLRQVSWSKYYNGRVCLQKARIY